MPFDYDFLMLWLADLESGKHKQAKGALRMGDAYCCLGRACDLHDSTLWGAEVESFAEPGAQAFEYKLDVGQCDFDAISVLPVTVQRRLGFTSPAGNFSILDHGQMDFMDRLSAMNDGGRTFAEIAAMVRTRPHGLFTPEAEAVLLEKWGPRQVITE